MDNREVCFTFSLTCGKRLKENAPIGSQGVSAFHGTKRLEADVCIVALREDSRNIFAERL